MHGLFEQPEKVSSSVRFFFPPLSADLAVCRNLTDPTNGTVTITGTSPNSQATYSCNEGFFTSDATNRTCNENGIWTGEEPVCESKDSRDYLQNGSAHPKSAGHGSS